MSFKVQIVDEYNGFNMSVRYENLAKLKRPVIIAKNEQGVEVKNVTTLNGDVLPPGQTKRQWRDKDNNIYGKSELSFFIGEDEVEEVSQTKVFEIEGYQDLVNYTDMYIIDKFYELFPGDNDMKKDIDRTRAIDHNASQMYKLWKYLKTNKKVARGEFCPSSSGFIASDGYIRAIQLKNKWGLEIGVFKQEKIFNHLQDGEPKETKLSTSKKKLKRIKMV